MRNRTFLSLLAFGLTGMGFMTQGASAPAAGGTIIGTPIPFKTLGVTTTLTTSGYHFLVADLVPPPNTVPTTPTFKASFALINHGFGPIDFQIPSPKVPMGAMPVLLPKVIFSVYDSTGALVWVSFTNPTNVVMQDMALGAGAAWRMTVDVPLEVNGQFLNGDYTLVAAINGTPDFSAEASFQVEKLNTAAAKPAKH